MNEAITFGISLAAALVAAVLLAIYRRATNTDLVERIASMVFASAPSAQNGSVAS